MKAILLFFIVYLFSLKLSAKIINKVAIIGAGPGGLSLYTSLKKLSSVEHITIFEAKNDAKQAAMGGGVQLTSGAVILENLDLGKELRSTAEEINGIQAKNAKLKKLFEVNVKEFVNTEKCTPCYSIMRDALQELLLNSIGPDSLSYIKVGKRLSEILEDESSGKISLTFEDGSEYSDYDMVFGADGINSAVKNYINKERNGLAATPIQSVKYSGLRIVYGVTSLDKDFEFRPKESRGKFNQWFGDGCYALAASYGGRNGPQHMLAVVYRDPNNENENSDWKGNNIKAFVQQKLVEGGLYKIDEISRLFESCVSDKFIDLAVRDAISSLPFTSWSSTSGRVVVLGDAAHAMAPFLGQGANQALQDAYQIAVEIQALSNLVPLYANQANPPNVDVQTTNGLIKTKMKNYENKRKFKTAIMGSKSGILGYLETLGGYAGMYFRDTLFEILGILKVVEWVFVDGTKQNVIESK